MKSTLLLCALLLCLVCFCDSLNHHKVCYKANICIHNGHEKCGADGQGNLRRFYDSCDILEYNCLKGTDYAKTSKNTCDDLPPIGNRMNDPQVQNDVNQGDFNRNKETANIEQRYRKADETLYQEKPDFERKIIMDENGEYGKIKFNEEAEEAMLSQGKSAVDEELNTFYQEAIEELNQDQFKNGEMNLINSEEITKEEAMEVEQKKTQDELVKFNQEKPLRKKGKKLNGKFFQTLNRGERTYFEESQKPKSRMKIKIYDFGLGKK